MTALNAALAAQGWLLGAEVPANPADLRPDDADEIVMATSAERRRKEASEA